MLIEMPENWGMVNIRYLEKIVKVDKKETEEPFHLVLYIQDKTWSFKFKQEKDRNDSYEQFKQKYYNQL